MKNEVKQLSNVTKIQNRKIISIIKIEYCMTVFKGI